MALVVVVVVVGVLLFVVAAADDRFVAECAAVADTAAASVLRVRPGISP
jgi:hypothetical protein